MAKHWKKIVAALVAIAVLVVGASFVYTKFINDPPDKLNKNDLDAALAADTTTAATIAGSDTSPATQPPTADTTPGTAATTPTSVAATDTSPDGDWSATTASELRYRVKESINGFDTEGVGKTNAISGTLTISGTTATVADFTVDMTTFTSDESRRDGQFNGRIMEVDTFPTGTFKLTSPIDFKAVPAKGVDITTSATGDLTLHGVTKSVTFNLTAKLANGKIGVLGTIPVLFSDYNIANPSFATIKTEDNGLLEFVLVFERA